MRRVLCSAWCCHCSIMPCRRNKENFESAYTLAAASFFYYYYYYGPFFLPILRLLVFFASTFCWNNNNTDEQSVRFIGLSLFHLFYFLLSLFGSWIWTFLLVLHLISEWILNTEYPPPHVGCVAKPLWPWCSCGWNGKLQRENCTPEALNPRPNRVWKKKDERPPSWITFWNVSVRMLLSGHWIEGWAQGGRRQPKYILFTERLKLTVRIF